VYRCRACRRKFSSKGSYRYHLSRCHVLATSASPKAACEASPRQKYHSQHHHHHHRARDADMAVTATEPSSDVTTISAGSAFGGCAPLKESGRRLQAHYCAEAKWHDCDHVIIGDLLSLVTLLVNILSLVSVKLNRLCSHSRHRSKVRILLNYKIRNR